MGEADPAATARSIGPHHRLLVALLAAATLALGIGRVDLMAPDEGRHAEIAREMLASGNYLTPTLEDEPYYDKPAAHYWLLSASIALFGRNEVGARVPALLAALWTLAVTARWAARAYSPLAGVLACAGLATTTLFVAVGRTAVVDMPFTAALTSALAWLGMMIVEPRPKRRSPLPFYAAVAVAVLLKGPVAVVITATVAMVSLVLLRRHIAWSELRPVAGILVVGAVCAPWYAAAYVSDPDYVTTFLLQHNVGRYFVAGSVTHQEPWYYYIIALPLALLPWTPSLVAAAMTRARGIAGRPADLYCLVWAAAIVAVFAPSRAKIVTYMLPAVPPLIALAAGAVSARWSSAAAGSTAQRWCSVGWTTVVALAATVATLYAVTIDGAAAAWMWLPLVAAALPIVLLRLGDGQLAPLAVTATSVPLLVIAWIGPGSIVYRSTHSLAPAATALALEDPPPESIIAVRRSPHVLAFRTGRTIQKVRWPADATRELALPGKRALLTKESWLTVLDLAPLPDDVSVAWRNTRGYMLLVKDASRSTNPRLPSEHATASGPLGGPWSIGLFLVAVAALYAAMTNRRRGPPNAFANQSRQQ